MAGTVKCLGFSRPAAPPRKSRDLSFMFEFPMDGLNKGAIIKARQVSLLHRIASSPAHPYSHTPAEVVMVFHLTETLVLGVQGSVFQRFRRRSPFSTLRITRQGTMPCKD